MSAVELELSPQQLRRTCDPAIFDFSSTEELDDLSEVIGQQRAVEALEFGIDIPSPGYHSFAIGPPGTGKATLIRRLLARQAKDRAVPDDWCYVNNFEDPERPRALRLPPGKGCKLRDAMDRLVDELSEEVPRAFEGEQYQEKGQEIQERVQKRQKEIVDELNEGMEEKGFRLVQTPQGLALVPLIDGDVPSQEQYEQLPDETKEELEATQESLQSQVRDTMRRMQQVQKEAKEEVRELDRQVVQVAVEHLLEEIEETFSDHDEVLEFITTVRADIADKVQEFKSARQKQQAQEKLPIPVPGGQEGPDFDRYRVNLVVDNCDTDGAPVVFEGNPTSQNLVGRVEHEAQFGALLTNYRMLRAGALHRANGGFLLVEARDLLLRPFAWPSLKRALKNREIKIESMAAEYSVITTRSLEPEPIPLDIKVVLSGEPMLYYLLFNLDPEFRELFKIKADFALDTDWEEGTPHHYAAFIGTVCREEELRHFAPGGVARVVEHAARLAADQDKVATTFATLRDIVREASHWAGRNGNGLVTDDDVQRAIDHRIYRSNQIEERIREMIDKGTLLIDADGEVRGQVNGLAVLQLGDYAFGKPSRITARVHVGSEGVVNIERETELGGKIHNKGVLILAGFLGERFAQDRPLALSASVAFEQTYQGVDGDSASSTELYALLSSLSGFPLRQDLAVTGSVNQHGRIQPIGGVNEKIEGFFDVCRLRGLTGNQGVLIPAGNVRHLMLRDDVVEAVEEGRFHIHAVSTADEGISLLTGRPAGERREDGTFPEGSVNRAVDDRLRDLAEAGRRFSRSHGGDDGAVEGKVAAKKRARSPRGER